MKPGDLVGFKLKKMYYSVQGYSHPAGSASEGVYQISTDELCIYLGSTEFFDYVQLLTSRGPLWFEPYYVEAVK